jgi:hypothetical protein
MQFQALTSPIFLFRSADKGSDIRPLFQNLDPAIKIQDKGSARKGL